MYPAKRTGGQSQEERGVSQAGSLIQQVLKRLGVGPRGRSHRINDVWAGAVGPEIASHSRPARLVSNVLTVEVDSSALAADLGGFRKQEILDKITGAAPGLAIKDIVFRVGRF